MTSQNAPDTKVADTRHVPLGRRPGVGDAVLRRIVPKRTTPPPQVAAFDSAM